MADVNVILLLVVTAVYVVIVVLEMIFWEQSKKFFAHVDRTIERAVRILRDSFTS